MQLPATCDPLHLLARNLIVPSMSSYSEVALDSTVRSHSNITAVVKRQEKMEGTMKKRDKWMGGSYVSVIDTSELTTLILSGWVKDCCYRDDREQNICCHGEMPVWTLSWEQIKSEII